MAKDKSAGETTPDVSFEEALQAQQEIGPVRTGYWTAEDLQRRTRAG